VRPPSTGGGDGAAVLLAASFDPASENVTIARGMSKHRPAPRSPPTRMPARLAACAVRRRDCGMGLAQQVIVKSA
jgi:hypothetical protein